jgi:hypothetical protein
MRNCNHKLIFFSALLAITVAALPAAETDSDEERERGFYFELAAGPAAITYGAELDAGLGVADLYGVDRTQICLSLSAGWAVSQNVYLGASIDGGGDRFDDGFNFIQINNYVYGLTLRGYPFGTGLLLGLQGGFAAVGVVSDIGLEGTSPPGYGGGLTVAYDFASRPTGFSVTIGTKLNVLFIEEEAMSVAGAYLSLLWK